jgi:hypothetical protein
MFSYKYLIKNYSTEYQLYEIYKKCMSNINIIEDDKICMSWLPFWNNCIKTPPKAIYEFSLCFSCCFLNNINHYSICSKVCFIIVIQIFIYDKMNTDIVNGHNLHYKMINDLEKLKIPKQLIDEYCNHLNLWKLTRLWEIEIIKNNGRISEFAWHEWRQINIGVSLMVNLIMKILYPKNKLLSNETPSKLIKMTKINLYVALCNDIASIYKDRYSSDELNYYVLKNIEIDKKYIRKQKIIDIHIESLKKVYKET